MDALNLIVNGFCFGFGTDRLLHGGGLWAAVTVLASTGSVMIYFWKLWNKHNRESP